VAEEYQGACDFSCAYSSMHEHWRSVYAA